MITLIFVGCVLSLTLVTDLLGFAHWGIPDGYEDEFGFHFGTDPAQEINSAGW